MIFDLPTASVSRSKRWQTNCRATLAPIVSVVRQRVKDVAAGAAFQAWRAGMYRFARPRITILVYHRVSDDARDNLTVGVEQFDRQMGLLRSYCRVLPIEEVVGCATVRRSRLPVVAVTFDDGYLDNYTNAAPALMRHRIPAAFFVSTGMIGTDHRFPHDIRRGNPPLATMRWEHLREMHRAGFTIGSHSVSHIDCAAEPEETVRIELAQSLADLRSKLDLSDVLFAYPYGGRRHMTPQRLELVKQAGYSGCLSAFGGANIETVDPFNVLRRGIHYEFTDRAFLFACLGLK